MKKDKVLVVDDDESIRDTLEIILKEDYPVLKAGTGEEALKKLANHDIPVVLLDIVLPGISGIQTLGRIRALYPEIKCVMISAVRDLRIAVECMRMGAHHYMTKELEYDSVRSIVRNAVDMVNLKRDYDRKVLELTMLKERIDLEKPGLRLSEDRPLEDDGADTVLSHFLSRCLEGENLTVQERKILSLLVRGHSNLGISRKLKIAPATVKTHIKNAFEKLGASSKSQAITYLLQKGLEKA